MGQKYIEDEFGVRYSADGATLLGYNREVFRCAEYRIKDGVKMLAANAFHHCQSLKSISMPDSVTEDEGSIFEDCKNLEEARVSANLKNPGNSICNLGVSKPDMQELVWTCPNNCQVPLYAPP